MIIAHNKNKLSDLVVRLNTGNSNVIPCIYTLENISVLRVLQEEGFLDILKIDYLKNCVYISKKAQLNFKLISKPSRRIYRSSQRLISGLSNPGSEAKKGKINIPDNGLNIFIVRTSKGIMSHKKAQPPLRGGLVGLSTRSASMEKQAGVMHQPGKGGEILIKCLVYPK